MAILMTNTSISHASTPSKSYTARSTSAEKSEFVANLGYGVERIGVVAEQRKRADFGVVANDARGGNVFGSHQEVGFAGGESVRRQLALMLN